MKNLKGFGKFVFLFTYLCLFEGTTQAFAGVKGNFEGLALNTDGSVQVHGWACATGNSNPIAVHVYVDAPYPQGTIVAQAVANNASEAGIATSCQATGKNYRFSINLGKKIRADHPEGKLYIHGIDPAGSNNPLIYQSGVWAVPADKDPPVVEQFDVLRTTSPDIVSISRLIVRDLMVAGYMITETSTAPSATASGWSSTVPTQYKMSSTKTGTKVIYAWAKDASNNVSAGVSAQFVVSPVIGHLEGSRSNADGSLSVYGWACAFGTDTPISVHLYFGDAWPRGTIIGTSVANLASEAAVATACHSTVNKHRFSFTVSPDIRLKNASERIYVHGIDPAGGANPVIFQSGEFTVPFDKLATPPDTLRIADTGSVLFGTYVFPGWTKNSMGTGWASYQQWPTLVSPFAFAPGADQPKRPFLNMEAYEGQFYDDSDPKAVDWMIKWSLESGVSLFVYDWYWTKADKPNLERPLEEAFLKSKYLVKYPDKIHFALLWANHTPWCYANPCPTNSDANDPVRASSRIHNDKMMDYVIENYFKKGQYLQIDKKPAMIIWSVQNLMLGLTGDAGLAELQRTITTWQEKAQAAGFANGIYFISEFTSNSDWVNAQVPGLTSYHYASNAYGEAATVGSPLAGTALYATGKARWNQVSPSSASDLVENPKIGYSMPYSNFTEVYRKQWAADFATNQHYLLNASPGWDNSPWRCESQDAFGVTALESTCNGQLVVTHPTGKRDYKLDYKRQLLLAKNFAQTHGILEASVNGVQRKIILNEAWDEWGEGAVIAPTQKWGFSLLDAIREVFWVP